jgi:hypothetical protein
LELLKPHLLGLIGNCLKGSAPKDFDYASRHTIRQLWQVLDEALIDFHRGLLERQQCKVSGNEAS